MYKLMSLQQAITELSSIEIMLSKITDEPEVTNAVKLIKEATDKLVEVEKGVSDHMEERR